MVTELRTAKRTVIPPSSNECWATDTKSPTSEKAGRRYCERDTVLTTSRRNARPPSTFAADRVVIHLGLNDTDPRDWPNYRDDFTKDYLTLIDAFRQANPKCEIWICRLTPISHRHTRFKSGTRDWYWQIQQNIEDIAVLAHTGLIDLHTELYDRPDLLPERLASHSRRSRNHRTDGLRALTGNYGGLQNARDLFGQYGTPTGETASG